jgi:hypothetical protein
MKIANFSIQNSTRQHFSQMIKSAWSQWLMPVIVATQEGDIRRIVVRSQPRQIVCRLLPRTYPIQKGLLGWVKWYSAFIASMKSWVQIPVSREKKWSQVTHQLMEHVNLMYLLIWWSKKATYYNFEVFFSNVHLNMRSIEEMIDYNFSNLLKTWKTKIMMNFLRWKGDWREHKIILKVCEVNWILTRKVIPWVKFE